MQTLAQLFHSNEGLFRARKKNSHRFLAEGLIIASKHKIVGVLPGRPLNLKAVFVHEKHESHEKNTK